MIQSDPSKLTPFDVKNIRIKANQEFARVGPDKFEPLLFWDWCAFGDKTLVFKESVEHYVRGPFGAIDVNDGNRVAEFCSIREAIAACVAHNNEVARIICERKSLPDSME
jgi:hypothetical protein